MPRKDLVSYSRKVGYRKHPGMVMWLFHRISGVIIGGFLLFHMTGASGFIPFIESFSRANPVISHSIVAFVGVMFVLHAANGMRIILMEFGKSAEREKFNPHLAIFVLIIVVIAAILAVRIIIASMTLQVGG